MDFWQFRSLSTRSVNEKGNSLPQTQSKIQFISIKSSENTKLLEMEKAHVYL